MNQDHDVAPEPEPCLTRSRAPTHLGGTLIAEDVLDLATHEQRLADPDGYRPASCPRCDCKVLHVHDYPSRTLRGSVRPQICIVRYLCADPRCGATWRILPAFVARHLWRAWATVAKAVSGQPAASSEATPLDGRTTQRWRARLQAQARQFVVLLATTCGVALTAIATRAGLWATRSELLDQYAAAAGVSSARSLGPLAALVHRLAPGLRLM